MPKRSHPPENPQPIQPKKIKWEDNTSFFQKKSDDSEPDMSKKTFGICQYFSSNSEETVNQEDKTKLWIAASSGQQSVVSMLLKEGADVNHQDKSGKTPLCIAASRTYKKVVNLLLKEGANVNHEDKDGNTPLCIAASYGYKSLVNLLLKEGADINHKNKEGKTALWMAFTKRHTGTVRLLLQAGASTHLTDNIPETTEKLQKSFTNMVNSLFEQTTSSVVRGYETTGITEVTFASTASVKT